MTGAPPQQGSGTRSVSAPSLAGGASSRASLPDLGIELLTTVTIVAEAGYIAGHFRCSGTHLGSWRRYPPTGRRFESVDELYFFEASGDRIGQMWSVEDTTERMSQLGLS